MKFAQTSDRKGGVYYMTARAAGLVYESVLGKKKKKKRDLKGIKKS